MEDSGGRFNMSFPIKIYLDQSAYSQFLNQSPNDWKQAEVAKILVKEQAAERAQVWASPTNVLETLQTKEKNHDARAAGATLIKESLGTQPRRGTYIFVNNRLEGNAPMTIFSMMERAEAYEPPDRIRFTVKTTFGTLAQNRRFIFRGREYL